MRSEGDSKQGLKEHVFYTSSNVYHVHLITGSLRSLCGVACKERPDTVVTLGGFDEKITAGKSFSVSIIYSAPTSIHRLVNIGGQGFDVCRSPSSPSPIGTVYR